MQVNAIIGATDGTGKTINTTISYLRASQKSKAPTLAQALNALTTNSYVSTKVNEINVDLEEKLTPSLNLSEWTYNGTVTPYSYSATATYTGDGTLYLSTSNRPAYIHSGTNTLIVFVDNSSQHFNGTIYATETDTYKEITLNFSR